MKYVALLVGQGQGCDYTIACNRDFKIFEADTKEAAIAKCREFWEYHGEPRIEEIHLLEVNTTETLPVNEWNSEYERLRRVWDNQKQIEELERQLAKAKGQSLKEPS